MLVNPVSRKLKPWLKENALGMIVSETICKCSSGDLSEMSSKRHIVNFTPNKTLSIIRWKMAGALETPNDKRLYRYNPLWVFMVRYFWELSSSSTCWYACDKSILLKALPPDNVANKSPALGNGCWSTSAHWFTVILQSPPIVLRDRHYRSSSITLAYLLNSLFFL